MAKQKFRPARFLRHTRHLARKKFVATFQNDGGEKILLPQINYWDVFSLQKQKMCAQNFQFIERPNKEALLRQLIYSMYLNGNIDNTKSIIDIGSWLADNALIWARYLNPEEGVVYAIDPAPQNIAYGKLLARMNGVANVHWIEAVCSDTENVPLFYKDSLEHARFNEEGIGHRSDRSTTTLDTAIGPGGWHSIGLLHVDVEGFELKVLRGAQNIIRKAQPVILFEQHISQDDTESLFNFLKEFGYKFAMINEVLPGCDLDCRNFIATPSEFTISPMIEIDRTEANALGVWYATLGSDLIPVD